MEAGAGPQGRTGVAGGLLTAVPPLSRRKRKQVSPTSKSAWLRNIAAGQPGVLVKVSETVRTSVGVCG